jgi:hypothetical protein
MFHYEHMRSGAPWNSRKKRLPGYSAGGEKCLRYHEMFRNDLMSMSRCVTIALA